mmetsp:Transcript_65684/g.186405  ORF Transcript_65684/g.186405 Transcript_65684/m.186405 type:complete len:408 (-) Transcript_65684:29-1252(-)
MGALCSSNTKKGADAEFPETMTVGGGVRMLRSQYLAGFKEERRASYPTVPMPQEEAGPTIDGMIDDVAKAHPDLAPVLYNDVKLCPKCGKPCAFTLALCNACGTNLADVPISKSENVFSAFLLGVARASRGFPFKISLRRQTEEALVIDDLLALTPCHFNCIPRGHYIPDWRFLLRAPAEALRLLDLMEAECWAAMGPFLENPEVRRAVFRGEASEADIRGRLIVSFNFPPSQFQLHVQWLVPPLLPFHHHMAEERNHFHEGRCFPMAYVREVLSLNEPYEVTHTTPVQEIVDHFNKRGVNYQKAWTSFYEHCLQSTMSLQNWNVDDFRYVVQDGKAYTFSVEGGAVKLGEEVQGVNPKDVQEQDKASLQNYGRPYSSDGKATGTYIMRPLDPKLGPGGFRMWPGVD